MIALLRDRDGMPTTVTLRDGRELTVWNIAWGYDIDDDYAHITTNCSPSVADLPARPLGCEHRGAPQRRESGHRVSDALLPPERFAKRHEHEQHREHR